MRTTTIKVTSVLAVLMMLCSACSGGRDSDDSDGSDQSGECRTGDQPGLSEDSILFGGVYPTSGPASAYGTIATGVQAFFDYANAELGGASGAFEGRDFEFINKDSAYTPTQGLQVTRELVEQENVFALFQVLGTPVVSAVWDYVDEQEVPNLFVATGATKWGAELGEHPWTIGWQPPYSVESRVYAKYLSENMPDASVAVLYQNDDYGQDYLDAFTSALEDLDSGIEVVAQESYEVTDPTVNSQMASLARTDADVFFNVTTPQFAAQAMAFLAKSDWDPVHLLNNVSASIPIIKQVGLDAMQGTISTAYFKDPFAPQFEDDEASKIFREKFAEYAPDGDPSNQFNQYGWTVAQALYQALETTDCATREGLMDAVKNMDDVEVPMFLEGMAMTTDGTDDGFPLEAMSLVRLEGDEFAFFGEVIDTRELFGSPTEGGEGSG